MLPINFMKMVRHLCSGYDRVQQRYSLEWRDDKTDGHGMSYQ